jgi:hypothetical protein
MSIIGAYDNFSPNLNSVEEKLSLPIRSKTGTRPSFKKAKNVYKKVYQIGHDNKKVANKPKKP